MKACEASLTEVMRQKDGNDLIRASLLVRRQWASAPEHERDYVMLSWARFPLRNGNSTRLHWSIEDMVNSYIEDVREKGYNESIFVCSSNRKCREISMEIRNRLHFTDGVVQKGDLLRVSQNNNPSGLMNGDMVEVVDIDRTKEYRANLEFRRAVVRELFTGAEKNVLLMTSTVTSNMPNLDGHQQTCLFLDFAQRMRDKGIDQKKNPGLFYDAMYHDPYLNALRCIYGYAITCHKAQGGEWNNVYVDFGLMARNPTKAKYQWAYTAVTRAKETLHVLNKPYIQ